MSNRTARLELEIDGRSAKRGTSEADRELRELVKTARQVVNELNELNRATGRTGKEAGAAAREIDRLERETNRAGQTFARGRISADGFSSSLVAMRNAAIVVIALDMGRRFLEITDAAKKMDAQLRLAIQSTTSFAEAQADVRRIAADTRIGLEATNELYSKFSRVSGDLGISQQEAARATETFAKTLKISGASTAEADAVTRQFGQALASGVLRGDEFNSVMEASPRLSRLLAESLGKPVGALREMAEEGELTADKLTRALTDAKFTASIDNEFKQLPVTFSEAMQLVSDSATITFSAFDKGGQFSDALVNFILGGVDGFEDLETSAEEFGITTRAQFEGLYAVVEPLLSTLFDTFNDDIGVAKDNVAELLGLFDKLAGIIPGLLDKAAEGLRSTVADVIDGTVGVIGSMVPIVGPVLRERAKGLGDSILPEATPIEVPSMRKEYERGRDEARARLEADKRDRDFRDSQPKSWMFDYTTPNSGQTLTDFINGTGAYAPRAPAAPSGDSDKPKRTTTPARTNQQVYDDFLRELAKEGINRNRGALTGYRTDAQQADLYARGISPARYSRHQNWQGVDVPLGASEDDIRAAAERAGVKGLKILREGNAPGGKHTHLQWTGSGKPGDSSDMEKLAQMEEQRLERSKQFFDQLQNEVKLAGMLPNEAERLNDELKLRAIINQGLEGTEREISEDQRLRIAQAQKERAEAELSRDIKIATRDAGIEALRLEDERQALARSSIETQDDELAVQQRLWAFKQKALESGIDLNDETLKGQLEILETMERQNLAKAKQNRMIEDGVRIAQGYRTAGMVQQDDLAQLGRDRAAVDTAYANKRISEEVYRNAVKGLDQAVWETSHRFELQFADAITDLAGQFKGKFGEVVGSIAKVMEVLAAQSRGDFSKSGIVGGLIGLFEGPNGNPVRDAATKASQDQWSQIFNGNIASVGDGLKGLNLDLKNIFGKGGDFSKGLGSILGKAGVGVQMGSATDAIFDALGIKSSKTGAQLGGAVGNAAFGPIGGIAGSILGGLVGGLFKKTPKGYSVITGGEEGDFTVSGNKKGIRENLTSVSGGLQDTLASIADQLGVDVGGFRVSIGQYKDQYRVSASGSSSVGSKKFAKKAGSDLLYAGDDPEAAMRAALRNAISDGALSGLGPTLQRAFALAGDDIEKGLSNALKLKGIKDELRSLEDPMNYALEELNKGFVEVFDLLKKAGGTAAEFADAEKLYQLKRQDIIENGNNAALKSMREYIFQLEGGTSSPLSPELRYSTASAELASLDAKRASGGKVSFEDYQSVADAFIAASRDRNGSNTTFFADIKRVTDTVQSMIDEQGGVTTPEIDFTPLITATQQQTAALIAAWQGMNGSTNPAVTPPPASTVNQNIVNAGRGNSGGARGALGRYLPLQ